MRETSTRRMDVSRLLEIVNREKSEPETKGRGGVPCRTTARQPPKTACVQRSAQGRLPTRNCGVGLDPQFPQLRRLFRTAPGRDGGTATPLHMCPVCPVYCGPSATVPPQGVSRARLRTGSKSLSRAPALQAVEGANLSAEAPAASEGILPLFADRLSAPRVDRRNAHGVSAS